MVRSTKRKEKYRNLTSIGIKDGQPNLEMDPTRIHKILIFVDWGESLVDFISFHYIFFVNEGDFYDQITMDNAYLTNRFS